MHVNEVPFMYSWEGPLEEEMALQYFCLENPMDRGAWWATLCGVTKNQTQLTNTFLLNTQ